MRQESGFTMVEMMVTVAIAVILLSIAVPAFRDFIQSSQMTNTANTFAISVNLAQTEATKRGQPVYLTALSPSVTGNEWGQEGWKIWVDNDNSGTWNAGDEQLREVLLKNSGVTFDSQNNITEFKFSPAGGINHVDTLFLCDQRDGATDRRLTLNIVGRLTVETDTLCAP